MDTKILESIGLTKSEIKVYLALLELGSSSTGPLFEKAKIASSKIYEVLDRLIDKGLVSFVIESGVKRYEAASPDRILDYVQEKKKELVDQEKEIKSLLPDLHLKRTLAKNKTEATVFRGLKGAETAFADILRTLKKGDEYYVMGASDWTPTFLRFIRNYHKKRAKKGIKVKLLYSQSARNWANNIDDIPLTKSKFASAELTFASFVLTYANKTLITVVTKDDITLFRIENKEFTKTQQQVFENLWKQAKK